MEGHVNLIQTMVCTLYWGDDITGGRVSMVSSSELKFRMCSHGLVMHSIIQEDWT